jgi:hypothetical protein
MALLLLALTVSHGVLAQRPSSADRAAAAIRRQLDGRNVAGALEEYERYVAAGQPESVELLGPIARAELERLAAGGGFEVQGPALEVLARHGDADARKRLGTPGADGGPSRGSATVALAKLGDDAAIRSLEAAAREGNSARQALSISALGQAGVRGSAPMLRDLLANPDAAMPVRAAAAEALGLVGDPASVPALRTALEDEWLLVRLNAAAALRRLGDPAGDRTLHETVAGDAKDLKLRAARALAAAGDASWVPSLLPLLTDEEPLMRIAAAELLLAHDPHAAGVALTEALRDQNPIIRQEAARVLASHAAVDVTLLRTFLRDADPLVRLHAAASLLQRAGQRAHR